MRQDKFVVQQKLSYYLVFQLVVQHHLNACDISALACNKIQLIHHILYHILNIAIQGKNVDAGFRMRVRMTQLPRLLFPTSAEFRILHSKFRPTDLNLANLKQLNGTAT